MSNNEISTQQLIDCLNTKSCTLLDIRPIAAYNGWTLGREKRGGHIEGARTFPFSWTEHENWPELLKEKEITPGKPVIVYGYNGDFSNRMTEKLKSIGFDDIKTYHKFTDWTNEDSLPMSYLPRFKQLVYPKWIQDLLDGKPPLHYDNDKYVICHASYRYREDYESGHIPGAVHMDTEKLESSKDWNRRSPEEIANALTDLGIDRDTTVILYGRFSHPNMKEEYPGRLAGHLAAIRCAQLMMYAGVKDVRVLNGGIKSWLDAGYEISTNEGDVNPVDEFGIEIPVHPEYIIDTPVAKEYLASDKAELVSVRSWEEFIGDVSGYHYIDKVGRIPGAVFGNCGSDAYHMENYRNVDHTLREYHEIASIWANDGIVPEKNIAYYCGTGWRASEAFLHAYLMGWPKVAVYDGGWLEWSSDPNNPVETGLPE